MAQTDIGQQTNLAAEDLKTGATEAAEHGQEAVNRLSAALTSARQRVQDGTKASARATDRAIRDYPYPSLGIAFGVGLLMGILISKR